jgi:hypothetical protein
MDMVTALNRDLQLLVYRCVFDYNYLKLKAEYTRLWLNERPCGDIRVRWCDRSVCFDTHTRFVANWRDCNNANHYESIYKITFNAHGDCEKIRVASIPKNY